MAIGGGHYRRAFSAELAAPGNGNGWCRICPDLQCDERTVRNRRRTKSSARRECDKSTSVRRRVNRRSGSDCITGSLNLRELRPDSTEIVTIEQVSFSIFAQGDHQM